MLAAALLLVLPLLARAQSPVTGTWSTGSGLVLTGPTLGAPTNNSFNYPPVAGISVSFTDDGYFEHAEMRWVSNATNPHCVQANVIWEHGNYTIHSDGTLTTDPTVFEGDGRIQTENACSGTTTAIYEYSEATLYAGYEVRTWRGREMLRLRRFDGAYLPRMFLVSNTPRDYMFASEWLGGTASLLTGASPAT